MNRFLILGFDYLNTIYYCLVRFKAGKDYNEYTITIMDGELERMLFGHHVLLEKNGGVELVSTGNNIQDKLRESIAKALCELLAIPLYRAGAK